MVPALEGLSLPPDLCVVQLLQESRGKDSALQLLRERYSALQDASTSSSRQLQAVSEELDAARNSLSEQQQQVSEQQQQVLAAVQLQGRTHASLLQLTAQHEQVRGMRSKFL